MQLRKIVKAHQTVVGPLTRRIIPYQTRKSLIGPHPWV
jgi:hypothetical protein